MKIYLLLSCILIFMILTITESSTIVVSDHWPKLNVLTFEYRPFVWKEPTNGRWIGFSIDVLDAIARKVGFTYSLVESNLELNLNIEEDFDWSSFNVHLAIGNINRPTTLHTKLIDLTEPILTHNHLSVLISRWTARALNLCTLENFLKAEESKYIEIGILSDYRYFLYLKNNSNSSSIIERLVNVTTAHLSMITPNSTFAFEESKSRTIGFLTEGHKAEYLAGRDCSFTILYDSQSLLPRETVIPLRKNSPYLSQFNEAIKELHQDGTIRRLRKKYWDTTTRCSEPVYHCTRSIL